MTTIGTNSLFGAVALLGLAVFFGVLSVRGLITGRLLGKNGSYVERDESPKYFTVAVVCYIGLSLFGFLGAIKMLMMALSQ
jgi:hypothetical protein